MYIYIYSFFICVYLYEHIHLDTVLFIFHVLRKIFKDTYSIHIDKARFTFVCCTFCVLPVSSTYDLYSTGAYCSEYILIPPILWKHVLPIRLDGFSTMWFLGF